MLANRKTKKDVLREQYIEDTKMYQRIAKVTVSSDEELGAEYDERIINWKELETTNL